MRISGRSRHGRRLEKRAFRAIAASVAVHVLLILSLRWCSFTDQFTPANRHVPHKATVLRVDFIEDPSTITLTPAAHLRTFSPGGAEEIDVAPPRVTLPSELKADHHPKEDVAPEPPPHAELFGAKVLGERIVFVVDRSISMATSNALARARAEVSACLDALPAATRFQVIFYHQRPEALPLGRTGELLPAQTSTIKRAKALILSTRGGGGTNHSDALHLALTHHPDVIYLATDAENLSAKQVQRLTRLNQERVGATIHVMDLSLRSGRNVALALLASGNGGEYLQVGAR